MHLKNAQDIGGRIGVRYESSDVFREHHTKKRTSHKKLMNCWKRMFSFSKTRLNIIQEYRTNTGADDKRCSCMHNPVTLLNTA